MCTWARSSFFLNRERLLSHCSSFGEIRLDDFQVTDWMAVFGLHWSTASTWLVCSTQPYRTVLHISCDLFSFLYFFLFMMVSFYTVFSFLSFYTGWILDLPSIGIYSMCPQRDSCGTVSLATIFFSRRTNSLRWRPGVSSYQKASTGWVIACIQYVYNNKKTLSIIFELKMWTERK